MLLILVFSITLNFDVYLTSDIVLTKHRFVCFFLLFLCIVGIWKKRFSFLILIWSVFKKKITINIFNMTNFVNLLTFENPVFSSYAYWGAVLIIKCLLMSLYTSFFRYRNKVRTIWWNQGHDWFDIELHNVFQFQRLPRAQKISNGWKWLVLVPNSN